MGITKYSIVNILYSSYTYLETGSGYVGVFDFDHSLDKPTHYTIWCYFQELEGDWRIPIPPFLYRTPLKPSLTLPQFALEHLLVFTELFSC